MNFNQELFDIKLSEMEKQYERIQKRIHICEQKNQKEIRKELQKALDEYHKQSLMLKKNISSGRSPAVKELSRILLECGKKMETLLKDGEMEKYLHCEKNSPFEDKAEATALYAEYAIDYAIQTMQYALIVSLLAMDLQINTESQKGVL